MTAFNRYSLVGGFVLLACAISFGLRANSSANPKVAPEFTHGSQSDWLNSPPLKLSQLQGKPVLVEFWTFDCINCLRSVEWVKSMHLKHAAQGLTIVGVHTPELDHEKSPTNVRAAVQKLGINYPVMLDRDYSYWNAMNNRYWPAFFLIDRNGAVSAQAIGEMHVGEARALQFEAQIEKSLRSQ